MEKQYNILKVPTIIFVKDGEEIGRTIETPQGTLEGDMAKIPSPGRLKNIGS